MRPEELPDEMLVYPPPDDGQLVEYRVYLARKRAFEAEVGLRAAASIPDVLDGLTAWVVPVTRVEYDAERAGLETLRSRFRLEAPVPDKVELRAGTTWIDANGVPSLVFANLHPDDPKAEDPAWRITVS